MREGLEYRAVLEELGRHYPRVLVLDAGLATSMQTDRFREAFPKRYFNLGIAEQNAVGVASGLARRGYVPFVHSFSNFLARRALDQIAVSVAWPRCDVKLIAGTCGVFDGRFGFSHTAMSDLAAMAVLPNMLVAEPGDMVQMRGLLRCLAERPGPAYLRIRRHGAPLKLCDEGEPLTTALLASDAEPVITLVACGAMLEEVQRAAERLRARGIRLELLHVQALQPLDHGPILGSARRTGRVVVVENHVAAGGFGDAISRALGNHGIPVARMAIEEAALPAGDPPFLLAHCRLDSISLTDRLMALLGR